MNIPKCAIRFVFILCIVLSAFTSKAENIISFRVSKTYCLINLLETMKGSNGTSETLRKYVLENLPKKDTTFNRIVNEYASIPLNYNYVRQAYPKNRHRNRSIHELIMAAAAKAADIEDFNQRIIGMLPNVDQQKLIRSLKNVESYYDLMIWEEYEVPLIDQMNALMKMSDKANNIFLHLSTFYQSAWPADFSFQVVLYPIPGKKGVSTATPHGNVLAAGTFTGQSNLEDRMAVLIHEMAHVLYNEQSPELQHIQERWFLSNQDKLAYSFIDEALATACGNGWAYEQLTGKLDKNSWYNHHYINGFAKALYPMVKKYIEDGRSMDSIFIIRSKTIFDSAFPKARYDYNILFHYMYLYNDAGDAAERMEITATLAKHFQSYSTYTSSPVMHEKSKESLENNLGTQLIVLHNNIADNMKWLKQVFKECDQWLPDEVPDQPFVLSFLDDKNRPIVIVKGENKNQLNAALAWMKSHQYIDPEKPYNKVN